ncbi:MAG TPA: hisA/hisF family protein [Planctomycetaceae bacterium]|nr:hisA/hisF family protein [Planctomycetaceae bacterium]
MRILPVLDLRDGIVVHALAGQRHRYRPLVSTITDAVEPLPVAEALARTLGTTALYVADLDAILFERLNLDLYRQLAEAGFRLLLDAGLRDARTVERLFQAGVSQAVAALETLSGPRQLQRLCDRHGPDRIVFSLDLREGRPMGDPTSWGVRPGQTDAARQIAEAAFACGVRHMIVLDLSAVGCRRGVETFDLCGRLLEEHPDASLFTGGGIRNREDLERLSRMGIAGALIATALHDGSLSAEDLAAFLGV